MIGHYLTKHLNNHESMKPQDVVKLCYQAAYGAEHLLKDSAAAEDYFYKEYEQAEPRDGDLFEELSPEVCRIDLAVWKEKGLPAEWLFRMFLYSAALFVKRDGVMEQYLETAGAVLEAADASFSKEEWEAYLRSYKEAGMPSVHHSEAYRAKERPEYRVVSSRCLCVLPILFSAAEYLGKKEPVVIALDGRAAAGKTTRAGMLQMILGGEQIHMDDFFLPPALRTLERLSEPGGNVHYERFEEEVLPFVDKKTSGTYQVFDCGIMGVSGKRTIGTSPWRIVEGSYSHHPRFGDYADIRVFCDVDEEEQMRRILIRNGEKMAEMFRTRWIPMEETYFKEYSIREKADLIVENGR